jgi:hypothetical protein
MFGSQILEVGIGLILVFLLVSLILTAVREAIETFHKTRARDLELAIAELLNDREGTGLRKELYEHPLVFSLFPGGAHPTQFDATGKVKHRPCKNVPSYIPREVFSAALQDILQTKAAADAKAGGAAQGADRPHIVKAYEALVAAAAGDAERARKGLERWYDASMDRASGWFKRRTQLMLLVLGVLVAAALNINAIAIAQYLATNEAARSQLVAVAGQVQREQAAAEAAKSRPDQAGSGGAASTAAPANEAAAAQAGNSAAGAGASAKGERDESDELARRLDERVRTVGLPIGWDKVQLDRMKREFQSNCWWALLSLIAGYLMVGFAATLGAPFWFDLLGKFMVVRSTVKPTEKSPDESSKDGGTGGSPKPPPQDPDNAGGDGKDGQPAGAG